MLIAILAEAGMLAEWSMPPAHPILVNFTAALVPISILSDWLGRTTKRPSLTTTGWWTLLYAALITPFTAYAGWDWMHDMGDMDHWQLEYHEWLGFTLAGVILALAIWRGFYHFRKRTPGLAYLIAATVVLLAVVVQGDLGGQMTFGEHYEEHAEPTTRMAQVDRATALPERDAGVDVTQQQFAWP